jgi:hypothetical protein
VPFEGLPGRDVCTVCRWPARKDGKDQVLGRIPSALTGRVGVTMDLAAQLASQKRRHTWDHQPASQTQDPQRQKTLDSIGQPTGKKTHTHTHTHTHNNNNARQRQTKPPHPTTNRHITGSRHRPHDHPAPPERRLQLNLPHEALSATE